SGLGEGLTSQEELVEGVGEDVEELEHYCIISQVLGNEIKFTVREPLGLRVWQFVSAVLFSGIAIMALAFPDQLYDAVFDGAQVTSKTPIRLYGGPTPRPLMKRSAGDVLPSCGRWWNTPRGLELAVATVCKERS
uniref:Tumor protein p53-inducible protein 11 n=1 Tax=Nomascus leucogenys TaxID=61853 RepID=A0A2I3FPH8_NOMLE